MGTSTTLSAQTSELLHPLLQVTDPSKFAGKAEAIRKKGVKQKDGLAMWIGGAGLP
ncbi:hypothetical protein BHE74_00036722 [Ensete ventricosum]|uniref:Uncharacterized protein n=1 Tax=Ensete ventricosum TaxID=4639 RepID=A0A426X7C8_ENSVE|nr:hypothetical protein B296_00051431 [Ensete ventricosum]RWW56599.1 hypothetical protein BHE74_00036722 [Ensete ventricosum]